MQLVKPYKVAALQEIQQYVGDPKKAVPGALVKALPVLTEPDVELLSWYPNTPDDAAGFRVYHNAAKALKVGKEIGLALLIDEPEKPATPLESRTMQPAVIFIPAVGGPQPKQVAILKNTTVVFVAQSPIPRSFTAVDGSWMTGPIYSPDGRPPVIYRKTFDVPGTYVYQDDTTKLIQGVINVL